MNKFSKQFISGAFLLFLFLPLAGKVMGVKPRPIENKPLTPLPKFAMGRLVDREFYSELTGFLVDTFPWRHHLVRASAWIDFRVLGDSPSGRVHIGREGWLFFDDTLRWPCRTDRPLRSILEDTEKYAVALRDSNREFRFLITPNKISIYSEFAGRNVRLLAACASEKARRLRALLGEMRVPGHIDVWQQLEAKKSQNAGLLYLSNDSHINHLGSVVQAAAIVQSLRPGLWDESAVVRIKDRSHTGDLTKIMGFPSDVPAERYVVSRKAVRLVSENETTLPSGPPLRQYVSDSEETELIREPAFVLHDSQLNLARPMLSQYFVDITFLNWRSFDPQLIDSLIAESRIVIVQAVEGYFYVRVGVQMREALQPESDLLSSSP
jgi:hypothetical protein